MRFTAAMIALLWATGLCALAAPKFISSLLQIPAVGVLQSMRLGEPLSEKRLIAAAEVLDQATRVHATARDYEDMGRVYLLLASGSPDRTNYAGMAEAASTSAIQQAPVRPFAWVNLATARELGTDASAESLQAMDQSFNVGPHVPSLALRRASFLLRHWRELDGAQRAATLSELRLAWLRDERTVARLARLNGNRRIIEYGISPLPGAVARLKMLLEK